MTDSVSRDSVSRDSVSRDSRNRDLKLALTVRAVENAMGLGRPKPFKVYRELPNKKLIIPRFFDTSLVPHKIAEGQDVSFSFNCKLRKHQVDAIGAFKGNGVLCLPCGQGKTLTAIAIASKLKKKTLVIVHKEFLATQWIDRIKQFTSCTKIGRIQGSLWDTDSEFTIAMIQTLCTREFKEDAFDIFGTVIIDEAHHIGAPAFSQVMLRMSPKYTLGLSATPERKDGLTKILYWFLGPAFYTMSTDSEIEFSINKVEFDYPPLFREGPHLTRFGKICMSTMVTELTLIPERNALILEHIRDAQKRGRKSLVLSDRRSHCEYLYSQLDPNITTIYMGGYKGHPEIGGGTLISTFSLAYEGLDIPELDTLFLTTPHSDVKQAVGRITRSKGLTREIWDIVDNWSLFKQMWYKRKKIYEPDNTPVLVDQPCLFS